MDPIRKRELKRGAFMRLAAQRRRAGVLRGRVVVVSLICFVVLWGAVFVQMATGNDPVLSAKQKTVATRGGAATRAATTTRRRVTRQHREEAVVESEPEVEEPAPVEEPLVTSQS